MNSYWMESTAKTNYPRLDNNIITDVCVIGAGITGISTAYMLTKNELSVTIVDKDKVCMGVTSNTTAKITSQHGLLYNYLINSFGLDFAKKYLNSNEEAIQIIKDIVSSENIDCDLKSESSYIHTCGASKMQEIENEVSAVKSLGLNAKYITKSSLPFEILSGIEFPNQAQFHPRKYLFSLLNIMEKQKCKIYENSKVTDIKYKNNNYIVFANGCKITCKYVVITSHYPIKNFPGMYFLKMYQDKSYIIAIDPKQPLFEGMYLSADEPVTSFRTINNKLLLIGGSSHKTGANNINLDNSYLNLENYAKSLYPNLEIKYKWSTQDCVTLDKVPYIGNFSTLLPNIFVATGFKKWGMTTSHVAAKIISDKILNKENPYSSIYTATRFNPIKNYKEIGNILKQTSYSLLINRFTKPTEIYENLEFNSGGVVDYKGEKLGIYKDTSGKIFAVKPYCTHLGCELSWNNLEKTWDCPCHGSRYDYNGKLLSDPSRKNLKIVKLD